MLTIISQFARRQNDWHVSLECLCADDFGAGYKDQLSWTEEDEAHYQNYEETRTNHQLLASLAAQYGIQSNIQDTDDRDSHHSDAYLYFWWSEVDKVVEILKQSNVPGDVLDVPDDFPLELERQARSYGWSVERDA